MLKKSIFLFQLSLICIITIQHQISSKEGKDYRNIKNEIRNIQNNQWTIQWQEEFANELNKVQDQNQESIKNSKKTQGWDIWSKSIKQVQNWGEKWLSGLQNEKIQNLSKNLHQSVKNGIQKVKNLNEKWRESWNENKDQFKQKFTDLKNNWKQKVYQGVNRIKDWRDLWNNDKSQLKNTVYRWTAGWRNCWDNDKSQFKQKEWHNNFEEQGNNGANGIKNQNQEWRDRWKYQKSQFKNKEQDWNQELMLGAEKIGNKLNEKVQE